MQAISALAFIPLGAIGEQTFVYKNFEAYSSQVIAITWHGIVHACRHINELYACQVSGGYIV